MIRFIDEHRDQFGVEAICRTLRAAVRGFITSRGYRAAKTRAPSARRLRDELLKPEVARLHAENYGVYGVRKMHALLKRQGWDIGRDQTARLMRELDLRGVKRSKKVFTTRPDKTGAVLPKDLVNRDFTAAGPGRLWVADITYVATWSGFAYVAFVTDAYPRRIVGWNVASTLRADILPLRALDMAAWEAARAGRDLAGLVHHADHGSNYLAVVYTDRIVELGAKPSTGTVGDSYDNALAEAVNGLYKTELIRRRGPWRTVEQVELATLEYVWWWNNSRLHGELDYRTPVEVEHAYYADHDSAHPATAGQGNR
jgi:putative transposase